MTDAKIHKVFDDMMKPGKILQAALFIASYEWESQKTGKPVSEVLHFKHPAARTPDFLPAFDTCPELVDLDITEEAVLKMARQFKGAAEAGWKDSEKMNPCS